VNRELRARASASGLLADRDGGVELVGVGEHVGGEAEGRRPLAGVVRPPSHRPFGQGDGVGAGRPGASLLVGEDGKQRPATGARVGCWPSTQALEPCGGQREQRGVLDGHVEQGRLEPVTQLRVAVAEVGDGLVQDVDRLPALATEEHRLAEREGDLPAPPPITGERQRFAQVLHGRGGVQVPLGRAELVQQLGPLGRLRWLLERPTQVGRRAVGGTVGEGLLGGLAQLGHDHRLTGRRREQQVGADLLGRRAMLGQELRGLGMRLLTVAEGEVVMDRGADDWMDEPARQLRHEELGPAQRRDRVGRLPPFQAGERGGVVEVRPVAQHRHGAGEAGRLLGKARQPRQHRPRHPLGAHPPHPGDLPGGRLNAVSGEGVEQLSKQEGIAAGGLVARGAERTGGVRPERVPDQLGDAGRAQRRRTQDDPGRVGEHVGEEGDLDARLVWPHRDDHQDGQAVDTTHEVGEPAQRRAIAPVQVVDGQRQRLPLGEIDRQPVQAVEHGEAGVLARARGRRQRGIGREQRRRQAGQATEQLLAVGCRRSDDGRLEQLPDDAVGELPLQLAAAGRQHLHPSPPGPLAGRREQARLADAGGTLDDDQAASTPPGSTDGVVERLQLGLALQQLRSQVQAASSQPPVRVGGFLGAVPVAAGTTAPDHALRACLSGGGWIDMARP